MTHTSPLWKTNLFFPLIFIWDWSVFHIKGVVAHLIQGIKTKEYVHKYTNKTGPEKVRNGVNEKEMFHATAAQSPKNRTKRWCWSQKLAPQLPVSLSFTSGCTKGVLDQNHARGITTVPRGPHLSTKYIWSGLSQEDTGLQCLREPTTMNRKTPNSTAGAHGYTTMKQLGIPWMHHCQPPTPITIRCARQPLAQRSWQREERQRAGNWHFFKSVSWNVKTDK